MGRRIKVKKNSKCLSDSHPVAEKIHGVWRLFTKTFIFQSGIMGILIAYTSPDYKEPDSASSAE
jgi:hypothetical protein